jgi:hypothetical protein
MDVRIYEAGEYGFPFSIYHNSFLTDHIVRIISDEDYPITFDSHALGERLRFIHRVYVTLYNQIRVMQDPTSRDDTPPE